MAAKEDLVAVQVRVVVPTSSGSAVFLGNGEKTFVIYVDQSVGAAITMFMRGIQKERPLTHDLVGSIFAGLGVRLDRVVINDLKNSTFFARLYLTCENELGKKIIEVDARPSDSIALALQAKAPIFAARRVFDVVEDMSDVLRKMSEAQSQAEDEGGPEEEEEK
ncbi:MAG: bifunctional nuclease family protein [Verrucomicrobia bacterium]|nr:bifunctional nuclease family protein [Verrucomicrobiota bacterium]